jgi:hypothetical protein
MCSIRVTKNSHQDLSTTSKQATLGNDYNLMWSADGWRIEDSSRGCGGLHLEGQALHKQPGKPRSTLLETSGLAGKCSHHHVPHKGTIKALLRARQKVRTNSRCELYIFIIIIIVKESCAVHQPHFLLPYGYDI